jgi:AhpC/TSA antioxidant enzyme
VPILQDTVALLYLLLISNKTCQKRATLPAVIGGYIGNPFTPQPWIEDALAVGMKQGRWPDNALELAEDGSVMTNKFKELPYVGNWERRPLELATLRLQSMVGISLANWKELSPDQEALDAGVLTQLGACLVVDEKGELLFEWKDPGICAVANFEDILKKLDTDYPGAK